MIFVQGKLNSSLEDSVIKIIGNRIYPLEEAPLELTESVLLRIHNNKMDRDKLHKLKSILQSSPGKKKLFIELLLNGAGSYKMISNAFKINMTFNTLSELHKLLGDNNIKVKTKEL